jgi:hypothetical protein
LRDDKHFLHDALPRAPWNFSTSSAVWSAASTRKITSPAGWIPVCQYLER